MYDFRLAGVRTRTTRILAGSDQTALGAGRACEEYRAATGTSSARAGANRRKNNLAAGRLFAARSLEGHAKQKKISRANRDSSTAQAGASQERRGRKNQGAPLGMA